MVDYQKLYAYLVGQIDEVLLMVKTESDITTKGILLMRVVNKLQDALWEAENRFITLTEGETGIDYASLYDTLKVGVQTAAKEAMLAALREDITKEALWANYYELQSILDEAEREFQEEIGK